MRIGARIGDALVLWLARAAGRYALLPRVERATRVRARLTDTPLAAFDPEIGFAALETAPIA